MVKQSRKKRQKKHTKKYKKSNMRGGNKLSREEFEQHLRNLLNQINNISPEFLNTLSTNDIDDLYTKYIGYNNIQRIDNELTTMLNYINQMPENMRPQTFGDLLFQLDDDTSIETINDSDLSDFSFGGKKLRKRKTKKRKYVHF